MLIMKVFQHVDDEAQLKELSPTTVRGKDEEQVLTLTDSILMIEDCLVWVLG